MYMDLGCTAVEHVEPDGEASTADQPHPPLAEVLYFEVRASSVLLRIEQLVS
jgi:hypothetical protein